MILRKPFAILIKNFKLIHLALAILISYMVYSTNRVVSFFMDYINNTAVLIDHDIVTSLFITPVYISIFCIFLAITIIVFLLAFKKKPVKFYLYSILTYIFTLVILLSAKNTISELEVNLITLKTLKLVQDLTIISLVLQGIVLFNVIITATGFNIKKFNFVKDLEELDITDVDSEEFEVSLEIDNDKLRRNYIKSKRYLYYVYKENKYVFITLVSILLVVIGTLVYLNVGVYNKTYKENEYFQTNEYVINIEDTYLSKYDYLGNVISDDYQFVIAKVKIKNLFNSLKFLKSVSLVLNINDHRLYNTIDYKRSFFELGNLYKNESIENDYATYILVYKIPNSYVDDKMVLTYTDNNKKVTKIKINPTNLNKEVELSNNELNTELVLENSVLGNTKVIISSFDVSNVFKETYNFCLESCIESSEYIRSSLNENDSKALLKLTSTITYDDLTIEAPASIYEFYSKFGSLVYTINGVEKTIKLNGNEIKAVKTYNSNTTYIEVPSEVVNADKLVIIINVRNSVYKYVLK